MTLPEEISLAKQHTIPANSLVLRQGDVCSQYVVVISGSIRVYSRSHSGKETLLYRIAAGEMCVLTTSCLLSNKHFPAEAITESEVVFKAISKEQFDKYLNVSPNFRAFVFSSFGQRLSNLITLVEQLTTSSIEQRIADYLLRVAGQGNTIFTTHQGVAEEIGSAREVVSRNLKSLEKSNIVRLARGSITVTDKQELNKIRQQGLALPLCDIVTEA